METMRNGLLGAAMGLAIALPGAGFAADGNWAGTMQCADGLGNQKSLPAKATLSGTTLEITVGSTMLRAVVDSNGVFAINIPIRSTRGVDDIAHVQGKLAPQSIVLKHVGGQATCSGTLS